MNDQDPELPELPYQIQFSLHAGRSVKPDPALEQQVFRALDAADGAATPLRMDPSRRSSIPVTFVMVGSLAMAVLAAVHVLSPAGRGEPSRVRSRDLAVQIPDTGDVWVDLPVDTSDHDADRVLVSFNAPASVALDLEEGDPAGYQRECAEYRCVHRWETSSRADDGATPRVRITEPGRYEFSVTHASSKRSYHERFVVQATR